MRKLIVRVFVVYNIALLALATSRPIGMTVDTPGFEIKLHHLAAMALYAVLVWWVIPERRTLTSKTMPFVATFIFGAVIEVIQAFLPHRSGQWTDLIPNTMGILIGYMLIIGIEILSPCPERNRQESVAEVAAPEE